LLTIRKIWKQFVPEGFRETLWRALNFSRKIWKIRKRVPKSSREIWKRTSRRFNIKFRGKRYLRDFLEASSEVGVRPFLMWDTLLGCVREGRLLTHDSDIDLGMLWGDFAKKEALVAAIERKGYGVVVRSSYKLQFRRSSCRLLIDVDFFYPWDGKMVSYTYGEDGSAVGSFFDESAFDRFSEILFLGDLLVPDPPTAVLTAIYGDWRTPDRAYNSRRDLPNRLRISPGEPMPSFPIMAQDASKIERTPEN